mgnify:CR=1 FL=1|tara:strand:+ start:870 stop:1223 length:354 start_codon:yes stop_codon:yes gene_type:complete
MKYIIIALVLKISIFAKNFSENYHMKNNLINVFTGEQIGRYFQYPEQSLSHSISGTSVVEFYVDTNGSLNDINIVNSLGPQFDKVIIDGLSKFSLEKLKELKVEYGFRYRLPLKFEN